MSNPNQKDRHNSQMVDKKFKKRHAGLSSGTGYGCPKSNYRAPRHPYKGKGNSIDPYHSSCGCCSRCPKAKVVTRIHNKKEFRKMIKCPE